MKVAVAVLPDGVSVTEVTEQDGRFIATDELYKIHPDERIGRVPYERLQELGEGVHEFAEEDRRIRDQVNDDRRFPWGCWLFFSVVCGLASWGSHSMFTNWETEGGRIRIHWSAALLYAWGGKWAVIGVLAVISAVLLVLTVWTIIQGTILITRKQKQLRGMLRDLQQRPGRMTISDRVLDRAIWISRDGNQFLLFVPEQFLNLDEHKRARRWFGPVQASHPAEECLDYSPPAVFVKQLGDNVNSAVERILDVFFKIYKLHPYFELEIEVHGEDELSSGQNMEIAAENPFQPREEWDEPVSTGA